LRLLRYRAVGVVLTGTPGDGASGLWAIKQGEGLTVVQDPKDAYIRARLLIQA
jgi:two-component system, chemotaxis family, protein-glutamate methylesterase/glutaminase